MCRRSRRALFAATILIAAAALHGCGSPRDQSRVLAAAAPASGLDCAVAIASAFGYMQLDNVAMIGATKLEGTTFVRPLETPPSGSQGSIADYLAIRASDDSLRITAVGSTSGGESAPPTAATIEHADSILTECGTTTRGDEPLSCQDVATRILRTTATRSALRDAFGAPDSVTASVEPNRHVRGANDSLFLVRYPGLAVAIRKPEGGTDMPVVARVTDNRYVAFPQIGIGAPVERVVETLGEPTSREADALVYDCGMGAEQPVTFEVADGVVTTIVIAYYVD